MCLSSHAQRRKWPIFDFSQSSARISFAFGRTKEGAEKSDVSVQVVKLSPRSFRKVDIFLTKLRKLRHLRAFNFVGPAQPSRADALI